MGRIKESGIVDGVVLSKGRNGKGVDTKEPEASVQQVPMDASGFKGRASFKWLCETEVWSPGVSEMMDSDKMAIFWLLKRKCDCCSHFNLCSYFSMQEIYTDEERSLIKIPTTLTES